ncbi:MAG: UDP-2,3-diacylglucosamine diphosphatase [Gammaproteobacteria bacterium]|nr:UDP-2,3-diacylglucosamine diphosphatase [Gammaproteobacteria bacterium]MCP5201366.1 UDP-2,3-diacylglucosamine diphosphatase [Gammaproteobacteria bacterium]
MATLFVSDLHLSAARPDKLELFRAFAARAATCADALYILGDLFEVWIGDDDDDATHRLVLEALAALSASGVTVGFMPGNRDFLCGAAFAARSGVNLLPDFAIIELAGERAVLTHGDLLCTQDLKYQRFRRIVRNPLLQRGFLATPLGWRRRIASGTQSRTRASMARKPEHIMDVEPAAVCTVLREHDATLLIHGHTHRPGLHEIVVDGQHCRRLVLGDWYEQDDVAIHADGTLTRLRIAEFLAP